MSEIGQREFLGIEPADLSMTDVHRLLLHFVAPRPIAFVSTLSSEGVPNLAPYSYFMAGGANPPSVAISVLTGRTGKPKDTQRNILSSGEFVINIVTYEMRERMNYASSEFPYGVSEWKEAGFTPIPSAKVRPARVQESPLSMECRLFQVVTHGIGHLAANYIIGEVVYFHIARSIMPEGVLDPTRVDYIARMGGDWYVRTDEPMMFSMPRAPKIERSGT